MNYIKMAIDLKEAAKTGKNTNTSLQNVERKVNEFVANDRVSSQDLVLAMGYSVYHCFSDLPYPTHAALAKADPDDRSKMMDNVTKEILMLGFQKATPSAGPNVLSSAVSECSAHQDLRQLKGAMKDMMNIDGYEALFKGGLLVRAVYQSPSQSTQSAILTVAEALSRDWEKEDTLDR